MTLIADIFLIAGALGAAFYCLVLSRRLARFSDLENGVGGAITQLAGQVTELSRTLEKAELSARASSASVEEATERAETAARRLELLIASLHDLPGVPAAAETRAGAARRPSEPAPAAPAGPTFLRSPRANGEARRA